MEQELETLNYDESAMPSDASKRENETYEEAENKESALPLYQKTVLYDFPLFRKVEKTRRPPYRPFRDLLLYFFLAVAVLLMVSGAVAEGLLLAIFCSLFFLFRFLFRLLGEYRAYKSKSAYWHQKNKILLYNDRAEVQNEKHKKVLFYENAKRQTEDQDSIYVFFSGGHVLPVDKSYADLKVIEALRGLFDEA